MKQSPFIPLGTPKSTAPRVFFRFLLGRPLDGVRRSDATFVRRGRQYIGPGWHTRWHLAPGWLVLAVRLGSLYAAVIVARGWWDDPSAAGATVEAVAGAVRRLGRLLYDLATAPWATLSTLGALADLAGLVLVVLLASRVMSWRRDREIVRPLALAIAAPLGYEPSAPWRPWLRVPRVLVPAPPSRSRLAAGAAWRGLRRWIDARESGPWRRVAGRLDGLRPPAWWVRLGAWCAARMLPARAWLAARSSVRVRIPHELGAVGSDVRGAVLAGVDAKLPGEWAPEWRLTGASPCLRLRARQHPPRVVLLGVARPAMDATAADDVLIGLGVGCRPICWTPESDSPHLLLSMGSGAGKSVLLRFIAAQALAKGWAVILLDYKQDHYWAQELIDQGVAGLWYLRKIPQIHDALIELEGVREWRSDVDFEHRGQMPMQRTLILFEEMNATVTALRTYWASVKEKGDPAKSPALTAFGSLSAAGRSARMHLVGVGQYLTAQVFGGPEARENFGMRILGRYTVAAWRTLVPEHAYAPKSMIRGRVQVCSAEDRAETQVPYLTHAETAEVALGGLAGVAPSGQLPFRWSRDAELPPVPARPGVMVPAQVVRSVVVPAAEPEGPERLTLAEWVRREVVPWPYETAKKARQRDAARGRFDDTADQRYTEVQMREWVAARSGVAVAAEDPESTPEGTDSGSEPTGTES